MRCLRISQLGYAMINEIQRFINEVADGRNLSRDDARAHFRLSRWAVRLRRR